jgi:hypothetical protein
MSSWLFTRTEESVVYLASNSTGLLPRNKSFEKWHRQLWCCGKFIPGMNGSNQPGFELSFVCVRACVSFSLL